jgi:hypothetical protein
MKVLLRFLSSLLVLLVISAANLISQITITKTDLESVLNNSVRTSYSISGKGTVVAHVDMGISSASLQSFDFSNITIQGAHSWDTTIIDFVPPAGQYKAELFPSATICMKNVIATMSSGVVKTTTRLRYGEIKTDGWYYLGGVFRTQVNPPGSDSSDVTAFTPGQVFTPLPLQMNAGMTYIDTTYDNNGNMGVTERVFSVSAFGDVKFPDGITRSSLRYVKDNTGVWTNHGVFVNRSRAKSVLFMAADGANMEFAVDTTFISGAVDVSYLEFSKKTGTTSITNLTVNGASSNFTFASGDSIHWSYYLPFGDTAHGEWWFDLDGNGAIDTAVDFQYSSFVETDNGIFYGGHGPGDHDGFINGHIGYAQAAIGMAPGHYIFKVSNTGGTAQVAGTVTPLLSVAHQISGHVSVPSGYPRQGIVVEAVAPDKFWNAVTDSTGYYTIKMNDDTSGNPWKISIYGNYPTGLRYYPTDSSLVISGQSYTVNFTFVIDGVASENGLAPVSYSLNQNYPNPFNPTSTITYQLPKASNVRLTISNVLGQEVKTLVNTIQQPGEHESRFDAGGLPSGVYFYRLDATSVSDPTKQFSQTRKMLVVR